MSSLPRMRESSVARIVCVQTPDARNPWEAGMMDSFDNWHRTRHLPTIPA